MNKLEQFEMNVIRSALQIVLRDRTMPQEWVSTAKALLEQTNILTLHLGPIQGPPPKTETRYVLEFEGIKHKDGLLQALQEFTGYSVSYTQETALQATLSYFPPTWWYVRNPPENFKSRDEAEDWLQGNLRFNPHGFQPVISTRAVEVACE